MSMEGKICLVTGAAGGIGRAASELLAAQGASVIAVDRDDTGGDDLVAALGGASRVLFLKADLTDPDDIGRVTARSLATFDSIDVLVNCAGIASRAEIPDVTPTEWDRVFSVNLKSVFFLTQRLLPHMVERKSGTIICISSASAKMGGKAVGPHYAASKAGIICLTKSLALYGAQYGITANCVCPGPTKTSMTDVWGDARNEEFANAIPLKRYATPTEVAETIVFLASDSAGYLTGETIDVNGGFVMD